MFIKKNLYLLLAALALSCAEHNFDHGPDSDRKLVWICHNPNSAHHDKECTTETENFCLEKGNSAKFCWILEKNDCQSEEFQQRFDFCR